MPRYAFLIEYDGAPFSGWQRQDKHPSVQEAIEKALAKIMPENPLITGAGRTDAGVHARGQVAHVDLPTAWDPYRLQQAVNHHLRPKPVSILQAVAAEDDFHARFSARSRRYLYRLLSRKAPTALEFGRVWQTRNRLDIEAMRAGAAQLIGKHDFTTFRSVNCQAQSPVKTLDRLDIEAVGEEIHIHVEARSFLHNQVRSFAGTLEKVGSGGWQPDDVGAALRAADRAACGPVAPSCGLYLMDVGYPIPLFSRG
ncbi:tRNA pseudouridine(38-40) synthase TruA [Pontivivens insulae]|uniref:tRNA pseudouridine synthase A n=1 Tax=Pontivivens insulae TaxID=1639689 RepID=A0A2R8AEE6_9RHOB|nr:tRNA pseudouridine(38-40) synthase TruA [Pontivivens insulae]RED11815.1 tRNA pseudouridine(38-40) synthase [Pontivivens insulae]SPF30572.1 tRNA pseudouridine synthase A [Pontivivens insulae]